MYANIEEMLLVEHAELYSEIKHKSIDELKLPMEVGESFIWFGVLSGFSMFWIRERRGKLYFKARKKYIEDRCRNCVRIAFDIVNRDEIFEAIDTIYESYLRSLEVKQEEEREPCEDTQTVDENEQFEKEDSKALLMWNDVAVSAFEKVEQAVRDCAADSDTDKLMNTQSARIERLFDELLQIVARGARESFGRKIAIYAEYIENDKTTLAVIAAKLGVSRECIRRYINTVKRNISDCFGEFICRGGAESERVITELAAAFEAIDYDVVALVAYTDIGERKKQAILGILFGNNFAKRVMEKSQPLVERTGEWRQELREESALREEWEKLRAKIYYPTDLKADSIATESFEHEKIYAIEKAVGEKLKKFESFIEIVKTPDIVYYETAQTAHRPDYLLRLSDGTSVLVLALATVNMALIYNIQRCNALHLFCRENGYGYLIIDDRGNSIYDLRCREIAPDLEEQLGAILGDFGEITWDDVKAIKKTRSVLNADIAAYVMQNQLRFTLKPFRIRRRRETN